MTKQLNMIADITYQPTPFMRKTLSDILHDNLKHNFQLFAS